MKIKSPIVDSRVERSIITGMVVSTRFLKEIQPILRLDIFQLKFAKTVAEWCIDYYKQYKIAPQKNIESLFLTFKNTLNQEKGDMVAAFLESISEEYRRAKNYNVDYALDNAERYFRIVSLQQISQKMKELVSRGDIEEGEKLCSNYKRPARQTSIGVNPMIDLKAIREAFSHDTSNNMFSLPGELGKMIGSFQREWLVSVVANSGIGKTWWLMYLANKAALAGFNVLFVTLEMSQNEIIKRVQQYINAGVVKRYEEDILIPVFDCELNQDNSCSLNYRICNEGIKATGDNRLPEFKNVSKEYVPCSKCRYKDNDAFRMATWFKKIEKAELSMKEISKKVEKIKRLNFLPDNFRLVHFPMKTLSMRKLETYMDNMEYYEGFIPDLLVTDYVKHFASDEKHDQKRFDISEVWEGHKMLAQKRKLLAISGHQGNTLRTRGDVGQGNWAEDISGLHLSDLSITLNQFPEEKERGVMRVSTSKLRSDDYSLLNEAIVLYSYRIGRPYLDSCLRKKNNL